MFDECIDKLDTIKITDDEAEAVGNVAKQIGQEIAALSLGFEGIIIHYNDEKLFVKQCVARLKTYKSALKRLDKGLDDQKDNLKK